MQNLISSTTVDVAIRQLTIADSVAVMALDASTLDHYPGDVATSHAALTIENATVTSDHRGWGAFSPIGHLVAMTFMFSRLEVSETDFTVVHPGWRRRGIGTAVKAACLLGLIAEGYSNFRTGGSTDNSAIIAANHKLGYIVDEEWLTFTDAGDSNV
ncbi:acetyltransferase [Paramicrobacterium fandaimingii]|uniref:acetyltransferase n=1 Tax=Paramicrobacterium fandaimingii TaxID=2708079 RepID=UPI00141E2957|nr:acetyltransferase [Microbacterium fandaimingii]